MMKHKIGDVENKVFSDTSLAMEFGLSFKIFVVLNNT